MHRRPSSTRRLRGRDVEIVNRAQDGVAQRNAVEAELTNQINATLATAKQYADTGDTVLNDALAVEHNARQTTDTGLSNQITTLTGSLNGLSGTVTNHTAALNDKADLDGTGHVSLNQIPPAAITN
jgi:hypothetical protein